MNYLVLLPLKKSRCQSSLVRIDGLEQRVVYVNPTLTHHSPPKFPIPSLVGDEYFQETCTRSKENKLFIEFVFFT